MKRLFAMLFVLMAFVTAFTTATFAADEAYFYVNSVTGDDGADGTSADNAVKTFTQGCRYAEKSGAEKAYIVITDEYTMPSIVTEINHSVPFVVTTKDATTDYGEKGAKLVFAKNLRYILSGDTTFENITIEYTGTLNCVARYNHITFGENVVTTHLDGEKSGLYVVGGWQSPENSFDATLDSHITVNSGDFLYVIGGSRQRATGGSGLTCTGTHYITVNGGHIANLLGGSAQHNWSQNACLTMSGGKVDSFSTGGDATRRLNGTATVTLTGGEIGTLNVNNVVGNATVNLLGTKIGTMSISYANAEIEELRTKAKSKKTLVYDANYYTADEIKSFVGFDSVENVAKIYVSADGKGSGNSENDPTSFEKGFEKAVQAEGTLVVVGRVYASQYIYVPPRETLTPSETDSNTFIITEDSIKNVTITGDTLVIRGGFSAVAASLEFKDIELRFETLDGSNTHDGKKATPSIYAHDCVIAADVTTDAERPNVSCTEKFIAYAGLYGTVSANTVSVDGAKVDTVKDTPNVELISGQISKVQTEGLKKFSFVMNSGNVNDLYVNEGAESYSFSFLGGTIQNCIIKGDSFNCSAVVDSEKFDTANVEKLMALCDTNVEKVFFVADGVNGSGATPNSPASSLDAAYATLGESGGTIVVCGPFTIAKAFNTGKNNGKITYTSVYDGVDYIQTNNARMIFSQNFYCGGETEFKNIILKSNANFRSIYANCHTLVMGENITTYPDDATNTYISIMGGSQAVLTDANTNLTINSGTWQRVRGGTAANGSKNTNINLTINGGEFVDTLTLGSSLSHEGNINAIINGGTFYKSVYASTLSNAGHWLHSNVTLTINGGTFYGNISPANSSSGQYRGAYTGTYTLNINGGDFTHTTDIFGTNIVGGMTSTLNVADSVDLDRAMEGKYSFTNPIRNNGADPWLFYCDGYYYYTATTGSTVGIAKAANIGDMRYAEYKTIYDPEDGHEWSRNLWSPEIHYYTDEEIGAGNGGWYLFLACDDGDNVAHRMYVVKCLDGNNLLGRWGNPITGEVNVPQRVEAKEIPDFDNTWAAGMSEIRINGKLYMLYITEAGRGTADMHQTINIVEMTNPWTIVGKSKVICRSEYDWEKGGYALNTVTGEYWPMVVEGSTAVYAEDGSVYIIYSGSGYWTTQYNLAQLKYIGGDPLEITSWEKKPEPILYKSDSINGCGHASYVTDTDGQGWVCYHAYIGKDTSSGRYAFVEPYFADKNGVVIADGSGHPAPIEKVYTVNVNPLSLGKRISGFDKINAAESKFEVKRTYDGRFTDVTDAHWFAPYVKNAYELSLANGTSQTKFSPDNTFTVAQALTAAANIHTVYYSKTVRAAAQGEAWYVPYVEYCVQNGIIKEGQFADVNANITRGDMAIVFANILPDSEYAAKKDGSNPDVTSDMACYSAVMKLYRAGIVGGDAKTGNYRPGDSIKRSEACVIFTRIAMKDARA